MNRSSAPPFFGSTVVDKLQINDDADDSDKVWTRLYTEYVNSLQTTEDGRRTIYGSSELLVEACIQDRQLYERSV